MIVTLVPQSHSCAKERPDIPDNEAGTPAARPPAAPAPSFRRSGFAPLPAPSRELCTSATLAVGVNPYQARAGGATPVQGYRLEPIEEGTLVTSYYDWSAVEQAWKDGGVFPVIPEAALRATLGILARTVAPGRPRPSAASP